MPRKTKTIHVDETAGPHAQKGQEVLARVIDLFDEDDPVCSIQDVFTDLMHVLHLAGADVDNTIRVAKANYEAEIYNSLHPNG